jgi:hypothetical protein
VFGKGPTRWKKSSAKGRVKVKVLRGTRMGVCCSLRTEIKVEVKIQVEVEIKVETELMVKCRSCVCVCVCNWVREINTVSLIIVHVDDKDWVAFGGVAKYLWWVLRLRLIWLQRRRGAVASENRGAGVELVCWIAVLVLVMVDVTAE